ncbi:MAG: RdgB/HAM1 family non-canonical purine NTP pyrophosphatase [Anaerolineae bacterium]|nr:RdgB/HAM1 family non-canonical purine NTP pyrophosphatase [Anaerolineae bacterium]
MGATRTLVVATHNRGKLREYAELLAELPATFLSLADLGIQAEPEEEHVGFAENARLKALFFARLTGEMTLADDSGLEVDALGGDPGARSARYSGTGRTDRERYELLLSRLGEIPPEARTARFRCAIAVASPEGVLFTVEGTCEGMITTRPRGSHGFGYDPVFYVTERGQTMAELEPAVKNRISHRARAAQAAIPLLRAVLGG